MVGAATHATLAQTILERTRTSASYARRLDQGRVLLQRWGTAKGVLTGLAPLPASQWFWSGIHSAVVMSGLLAHFVQDCFARHEPIWLVKHAILSVQTNKPQWRGQLKRAWNAFKAWQLRLPASHRTPISEPMLRTLFVAAVHFALDDVAHARHWLTFAVLLRVGFYALLRPGELCALCASHIAFPPLLAGHSPIATIGIADPKTRAVFTASQFCICSDPSTMRWLAWLLAGLPPSTKLWPGSTSLFRSYFSALTSRLRLAPLRLTPEPLHCSSPALRSRPFDSADAGFLSALSSATFRLRSTILLLLACHPLVSTSWIRSAFVASICGSNRCLCLGHTSSLARRNGVVTTPVAQ